MQFLSDVSLDGDYVCPGRGNAGESEFVVSRNGVGWLGQGVIKRDVHTKGLAIDFARESTLRSEPDPILLHAFVLDIRVLGVGPDHVGHEVAELQATSGLKLLQHALRRTEATEVHVLGRAYALEAKLEHETSLEPHSLLQLKRDSVEKPFENHQLATPREIHARRRARA